MKRLIKPEMSVFAVCTALNQFEKQVVETSPEPLLLIVIIKEVH